LFCIAVALQTEKFYDFAGSLNFLLVAAFTFSAHSTLFPLTFTKQHILTGLVCIWAFRLGSFLLFRVIRVGKDARFDRIKTRPLVFWVVWTIQACWVWIVSLPLIFINAQVPRYFNWSFLELFGLALWVVGFVTEVTADLQKNNFRAEPSNTDKFIQTGFWKYE